MFKFIMVRGNVLVDDVKNRYSEMARPGMELDEGGNYLIATAQNSYAEMLVGGQHVSLGPESFCRTNGPKSATGRHNVKWTRDVRLFFGKLWAHIANDSRWDVGGGGGGGIRG